MSYRTQCAIALLLAGCSLRPFDAGDSATDATSTGDTTSTGGTTALPGTGAPTTSGADTGSPVTSNATNSTSTTDDASSTADGTTHSFITPPDAGPDVAMCDVWIQDCPEGQKCMPYSGDGDNHWESLRCVDIVPNPAGMYEPCTAGPISTGEDTCDKGLMCWNVDFDTGMGHCIGLCIGGPEAPDCVDPLAWCAVTGSGVLALCLPMCDPLLQNCPGGDLCLADAGNPEAWICVLDASGEEGQAFDVCEYANACDPGLFCTDPSVAAECDAKQPGCCTPLCDLTQPNTCPGQGQECLPWYEPGMAPPPHEHVGYCTLPMP